jgi:hypothetical protein
MKKLGSFFQTASTLGLVSNAKNTIYLIKEGLFSFIFDIKTPASKNLKNGWPNCLIR